MIPEFTTVKRFKGTQSGNAETGEFWLTKLCFGKEDGTEITKVELDDNKPYGTELVLDESKEIIGVYGTKDKENYIY